MLARRILSMRHIYFLLIIFIAQLGYSQTNTSVDYVPNVWVNELNTNGLLFSTDGITLGVECAGNFDIDSLKIRIVGRQWFLIFGYEAFIDSFYVADLDNSDVITGNSCGQVQFYHLSIEDGLLSSLLGLLGMVDDGLPNSRGIIQFVYNDHILNTYAYGSSESTWNNLNNELGSDKLDTTGVIYLQEELDLLGTGVINDIIINSGSYSNPEYELGTALLISDWKYDEENGNGSMQLDCITVTPPTSDASFIEARYSEEVPDSLLIQNLTDVNTAISVWNDYSQNSIITAQQYGTAGSSSFFLPKAESLNLPALSDLDPSNNSKITMPGSQDSVQLFQLNTYETDLEGEIRYSCTPLYDTSALYKHIEFAFSEAYVNSDTGFIEITNFSNSSLDLTTDVFYLNRIDTVGGVPQYTSVQLPGIELAPLESITVYNSENSVLIEDVFSFSQANNTSVSNFLDWTSGSSYYLTRFSSLEEGGVVYDAFINPDQEFGSNAHIFRVDDYKPWPVASTISSAFDFNTITEFSASEFSFGFPDLVLLPDGSWRNGLSPESLNDGVIRYTTNIDENPDNDILGPLDSVFVHLYQPWILSDSITEIGGIFVHGGELFTDTLNYPVVGNKIQAVELAEGHYLSVRSILSDNFSNAPGMYIIHTNPRSILTLGYNCDVEMMADYSQEGSSDYKFYNMWSTPFVSSNFGGADGINGNQDAEESNHFVSAYNSWFGNPFRIYRYYEPDSDIDVPGRLSEAWKRITGGTEWGMLEGLAVTGAGQVSLAGFPKNNYAYIRDLTRDATTTKGIHLLGNPYTAPLSIAKMMEQNQDNGYRLDNIYIDNGPDDDIIVIYESDTYGYQEFVLNDGTGAAYDTLSGLYDSRVRGYAIFFWDRDSRDAHNDYNSVDDFTVCNASQCVTGRQGNAFGQNITIDAREPIIPPMQGFEIVTPFQTEFQINKSMIYTETAYNDVFYSEFQNDYQAWFSIQHESGYLNQICGLFGSEFNDGFIAKTDIKKSEGSSNIAFYFNHNILPFIKTSIKQWKTPRIEHDKQYPLGVYAGNSGKYTFQLDKFKGQLPVNYKLFLIDDSTGTKVEITRNQYQVNLEKGRYDDRFYLSLEYQGFVDELSEDQTEDAGSGINTSIYERIVRYSFDSYDSGILEVFQLNGQLIYTERIQESAEGNISIPVGSGAAIVKITTDSGKQTVFKTIL